MIEDKTRFSEHKLTVETHGDFMLYKFERDDSWDLRTHWLVGHGVTMVTGDLGRWSFSREIHPNGERLSRHYWDEKLEAGSKIKATAYDQKTADLYINYLLEDALDELDRDGSYEDQDEPREQLNLDALEALALTGCELDITTHIKEGGSGTLFDGELTDYLEGFQLRHYMLDLVYTAFECMTAVRKGDKHEDR